jgi:hypothetical protein
MVQVQQSSPLSEEDENKPIELSDNAKRIGQLVQPYQADRLVENGRHSRPG